MADIDNYHSVISCWYKLEHFNPA